MYMYAGSNKNSPGNKESASRTWKEAKADGEAGYHGVCSHP